MTAVCHESNVCIATATERTSQLHATTGQHTGALMRFVPLFRLTELINTLRSRPRALSYSRNNYTIYWISGILFLAKIGARLRAFTKLLDPRRTPWPRRTNQGSPGGWSKRCALSLSELHSLYLRGHTAMPLGSRNIYFSRQPFVARQYTVHMRTLRGRWQDCRKSFLK